MRTRRSWRNQNRLFKEHCGIPEKKPEHSFVINRHGAMTYCKYGSIATYANKTQAGNKCASLRLLGYDCFVSFSHPFLILLNTVTT